MKSKPELYQETPASTLQQIFNFNAADLQANTDGYLTPRQMRRVRFYAFSYIFTGLIFVIGFIGIVILVISLRQKSTSLVYIIPILLVIIFAAGARLQNRIEKHGGLWVDARSDIVNQIVGTPYFVTPKEYEGKTYFSIKAGGWELYVDEQQYYEFRTFVNTHRGYQEYVFFFLPHSKLVMSVRMIGMDVREWFDTIDA